MRTRKRKVKALSMFMVLCMVCTCLICTTGAFAEGKTVYMANDATGTTGTIDDPVGTFSEAKDKLTDGDNIEIIGEYDFIPTDGETWDLSDYPNSKVTVTSNFHGPANYDQFMFCANNLTLKNITIEVDKNLEYSNEPPIGIQVITYLSRYRPSLTLQEGTKLVHNHGSGIYMEGSSKVTTYLRVGSGVEFDTLGANVIFDGSYTRMYITSALTHPITMAGRQQAWLNSGGVTQIQADPDSGYQLTDSDAEMLQDYAKERYYVTDTENNRILIKEAKSLEEDSIKVFDIENQSYTGEAIEPAITVKDGDTELVEGKDYEVSYADNVEAGTATATITGLRKYKDSVEKTFTIIDPDVEAVVAMIEALPEIDAMKRADVASVQEAKAAYDALSEAQQAKIDAGLTAKLSDAVERAGEILIEAAEAADVRDQAVVELAQLDKLTDGNLYTAESYQAYADAYEAFRTLALDDEATTKQLRAARTAVTRAYTALVKKADISSAKITGLKAVNYTGKAQTQNPVVTLDGVTLTKDTEYTVSYKNNKNAGTATVTVTGTGDNHMGTATATFKINKIAQKMTATAKTKTVKVSKVKKAKQTVAPITVKNAQGTKVFKKASGSNKLTVNAKTGKVTVKKGTKKGTYKCKVKVTAKGNTNYKAMTKTVNVTVKVK